MKVFVSSLISGMKPLRDAARDAIESLGHEAILAEDLRATPTSPQKACLDAVRRSDAVVLILGARYGNEQASGLSATHEEYRDARGLKPVFAFVQGGVDSEPSQAAFINEAQHWGTGLFRGEFSNAADLRRAISQALHRWEVASAAGAPDAEELLRRALDLVANDPYDRNHQRPKLVVSMVGGPRQSILRPSELEVPAFAQDLLKEAFFGRDPLLDHAKGARPSIKGHTLALRETDDEAYITLDEEGGIAVSGQLRRSPAAHGLSALIEEHVNRQLISSLAFGAWLLNRIDPTEKLTHVAVAAKIHSSGGFTAWRTIAEDSASPNSMMVNLHQSERASVHLAPPLRTRAALRLESSLIADDLLTLLRRQWK